MNAVERLWRALRERDWKAVAAQMHPDVVTEYPASGERFTGPQEYVMSHRLRPEEVAIERLEIVNGALRSAVYAVIRTPSGIEHMMGLYDLHETRIARIVELWAVAGDAAPAVARVLMATVSGAQAARA